MAAVVLVTLLGWYGLPFLVPLPAGLAAGPTASPVLLDRHSSEIMHLTLPDFSRATPFTLAEIPPDFVACTLAAEDKRFYQHGGIDLLATLRAAGDWVAKRRVVSGASTITQQLIKITSPPAERGLLTKIREVLAARRLEMSWSKQQILTAYLNRLDYGNLRIGTAEAARFYFQKPLTDLSLAECALLAGLPQAPSRLNLIRHPQRAKVRRDTVLNRLAANGNHDAGRIAAALAESIVLRPLVEDQPAPWLANPSQISNFNSQIPTTLDLPLQNDVQTIVREETAKLKESNLRHAAVVIIDNPTGEILALVSSADWDDPRGGQMNGALVPRSPGSTLKPFTYLLALERNHRIPASILADIPTPFRTEQGLDLPGNYDRTYRGPVTLRAALACSLNVPAMCELNALGGPQPLFDLLKNLGITTLGDDSTHHGLGLTLGNAPVNLLELTNAYATLARLGCHLPPTLFPSKFDAFGELSRAVGPSMFDVTSSFLIADILSDATARAPAFQPGGPLDLPFRCAAKTGTSSDFRDNWCIGYTPRFTVGVWAGNFEQQPMKNISGIAGAAPIFQRAMLRLHREISPTWFERPPGIVEIVIDPKNGKLTPQGTNNDLAPADRLPPSAVSTDYDVAGRALLDPIYTEWFHSPHNRRHHELALDPAASAREPLRIITPADQAIFLLDPEIPSGSDKLRPVTNLPGTARWKSETLRIEHARPEPIIHLTAGTHILTATDPVTGVTHKLTLRVKSL